MTIIELGEHRRPVVYSVTITEGWDGSIRIEVDHIQDDPRSRFAVADAMSRGSLMIKEHCREVSK